MPAQKQARNLPVTRLFACRGRWHRYSSTGWGSISQSAERRCWAASGTYAENGSTILSGTRPLRAKGFLPSKSHRFLKLVATGLVLASGRNSQLRRFVNQQHNCTFACSLWGKLTASPTDLLLERMTFLPQGRLT